MYKIGFGYSTENFPSIILSYGFGSFCFNRIGFKIKCYHYDETQYPLDIPKWFIGFILDETHPSYDDYEKGKSNE